jgi:hypothetical protein
VVFYDANGRQLQAFDYSTDEAARDFGCCAISPSNNTAVVGACNRLYVFSLSNSTGVWQHMAVKQVGVRSRRPLRRLLFRASCNRQQLDCPQRVRAGTCNCYAASIKPCKGCSSWYQMLVLAGGTHPIVLPRMSAAACSYFRAESGLACRLTNCTQPPASPGSQMAAALQLVG